MRELFGVVCNSARVGTRVGLVDAAAEVVQEGLARRVGPGPRAAKVLLEAVVLRCI